MKCYADDKSNSLPMARGLKEAEIPGLIRLVKSVVL